MHQFRDFMRKVVSPIALASLIPPIGLLLRALLKALLDVELSKLLSSVIGFFIAAFLALFIFPSVLKQPFGKARLSDYLRRLGIYFPRNAWKHIVLGMVLALCTVAGMLFGSILTGRYVLDWRTINISHIVFSINPGIWEELAYRGIIMFILLKNTRSVQRSVLIQILIFSLFHIKGFDLWSWVDVLSVVLMAVAFTYSAWKTRLLLAGMVFHFLHDALLYFAQVPEGEYIGLTENIMFYAALWAMIGVACLVIKVATEKLGVQAEDELYQVEPQVEEEEDL